MFEAIYYVVDSLDGDYANLLKLDAEAGEESKLVARALLPATIEVGTKLKYEMMQYSILVE